MTDKRDLGCGVGKHHWVKGANLEDDECDICGICSSEESVGFIYIDNKNGIDRKEIG